MTLYQASSLDDHFFHIRFAELLREKGVSVLTDFQSIYFSRMGIGHDYFVYYSFLFHLALIPFTLVTPLVVGIKLYGVMAISLSLTIVYVFLRKVSVKYPFLWVILFMMVLMQSGWFVRFTLARPFTLAPVILVLMLYFMYERKHLASFFIAFLYFFWHTATFPFPFLLAFGYFLFEQFYGKRPDWKMIAWPFFGTILAVLVAYLISPGVISYLREVIFPVFFDTTLTKETGIAEGGEVYGRNFFSTLTGFFWFLATLLLAGAYEIARYVREKRGIPSVEDTMDLSMQPLRLMLFVASIAFLAATSLSARFLDYFVYFCLLYVAIAVTDISRFIEIRGAVFRKSFFTSIILIVVFLFVNYSLNFHDTLAGTPSYLIAQAPAEWLNIHVEKGTIIFNTSWDSFPVMYYFTGDAFRFVTGLEPRFLYDLDHRLYWVWNNIGQGLYCEESDCSDLVTQRNQFLAKEDGKNVWYEHEGEQIADAVFGDFHTDIILVGARQKNLLDVMDHSSRFKKEFFEDKYSAYAVYRVMPREEK
jgi:hypothetical protein